MSSIIVNKSSDLIYLRLTMALIDINYLRVVRSILSDYSMIYKTRQLL